MLEFGYCFDVAIRAFLPVWLWLYVVQFLLMPVVARDYWLSLFLGNSLYLVAFGYYFVITFLGYNGMFGHLVHLLFSPSLLLFPSASSPRSVLLTVLVSDSITTALPFLHHTHLLLSPIAVLVILWFASLFGLNLPKHFAPVLWTGAGLRGSV